MIFEIRQYLIFSGRMVALNPLIQDLEPEKIEKNRWLVES